MSALGLGKYADAWMTYLLMLVGMVPSVSLQFTLDMPNDPSFSSIRRFHTNSTMLTCMGAVCFKPSVAVFPWLSVLILWISVLSSPSSSPSTTFPTSHHFCTYIPQDGDFGKQRTWGSIGFGAFALIAGWVMTQFGSGTSFAIFGIMSIPMAGIGLKLRYNYSKQQQHQQHEQVPMELLKDPYDQQRQLLEQHLQQEALQQHHQEQLQHHQHRQHLQQEHQQHQQQQQQLLLGSGEGSKGWQDAAPGPSSAGGGVIHRGHKGQRLAAVGAAAAGSSSAKNSSRSSSSSHAGHEEAHAVADGDIMGVVLQPASLLFLWRAVLMGFGMGVMTT
jgi:hypothetical protein